MLICCQAVRRGTARALVSCDMPFGPVQEGIDSALAAASRLMNDGGADMIKVDAAADFPDVVRALVKAGVPSSPQFGLTPQTAGKYGIPYSAQNSPAGAGYRRSGGKAVARQDFWKTPARRCSTSPIPAGRRLSRRQGGADSSDRRFWRRAMARRPGAARAYGYRLCGEMDRRQDRYLCQHGESRAGRVHRIDRRRPRRPQIKG